MAPPPVISSSEHPSHPDASYEARFEYGAVFEFSKVINTSLDQQFILSHILLTIMGKMLSSRGLVALVRGKDEVVIEMAKGFPASLVGQSLTISSLAKTLVDLEEMNGAADSWVQLLRGQGVRYVLPMYSAEEPIGLLAFGARLAEKKLTPIEESYLGSLANISASAIEKCRIIHEVRSVNRKLDRKVQELNTLFDLGKEFGALLDPDKLVRLLVFSLLGQVGVSRYLICLQEGPDMNVAASRVDGPTPQRELLRTLADVRNPTLVSDMIVKKAIDPRETLTSMGLRAIVPMQLQGETKGLILLGEKLSREEFTQADFEFLFSLGNLAIISIENARLFKEAIEKQKLEDELLIAREIQKGLLPSVLPDVPGFQLAAANISSKQVGGDYYDVLATTAGHYVIAIGDVSGKGYPAALLMATLQATIRALVPLGLPLSELTGRVNDLMCPNTGGDKFITFFWADIDPQSHTLTYVNAGHNYPLLMDRDGNIRRLDKGGMILGIMKTTSPYELETVALTPGSVLVLFTDGVSEAMNVNSVEYGEERLEDTIRAHQHLTAQQLVDTIHQDILKHTGNAPQSDDITMMVVKVG